MAVFQISGTEGGTYNAEAIDSTCYRGAFDSSTHSPTISTAGTCLASEQGSGSFLSFPASPPRPPSSPPPPPSPPGTAPPSPPAEEATGWTLIIVGSVVGALGIVAVAGAFYWYRSTRKELNQLRNSQKQLPVPQAQQYPINSKSKIEPNPPV